MKYATGSEKTAAIALLHSMMRMVEKRLRKRPTERM